jgi:uncharacterized protein YciI
VALDYGSETAPDKHEFAGDRWDGRRERESMAKFAVIIAFGDKAKRDEARPAHREYLKSLLDQGKLMISGPFADDDGALIIYDCADEAAARAQLAADPYSQSEGVVADAQIREWKQVFPA